MKSNTRLSRIYPWIVVALLWVVALLNSMDRQMLSTMRESMQIDITELESAVNFGRLMAIFLWIYGLVSPFAGAVADRISRKWLIVGSLGVWSAVTLLMGYCNTYNQVFWLRALMGVSEALYMSFVGMLYNVQLLKVAGEDGVAAYGVLMYVCMIFIAIFIGYSIGTAPIVSYNYGSGNTAELKNLFKKSLLIIGATSFAMLIFGEVMAAPLSQMFVGYDPDLYAMTVRGFYIFSFSFLFSGIPIWGSGFFTALNNGIISAIISFLRTLVFQSLAVMILPIFFDLDGIWFSIVIAEIFATMVTAAFLVAKKKKYKYC